MKPYTRIAGGAALLIAAAVACSDNPLVIGRFGLDGRWEGSALAGAGTDTVRFYFDLSLQQDREDVAGDGEIRGGTATLPVDVGGTWAATGGRVNVGLTMRSAQVAPVTFTGSFDVDTVAGAPVFDPDTLVGTLSGSALDGAQLRLGRSATP